MFSIFSLFVATWKNLSGCKACFFWYLQELLWAEKFPHWEAFQEKASTAERNIFWSNLEEWVFKYGLWNINVPILHIIMCLHSPHTFWDCVDFKKIWFCSSFKCRQTKVADPSSKHTNAANPTKTNWRQKQRLYKT